MCLTCMRVQTSIHYVCNYTCTLTPVYVCIYQHVYKCVSCVLCVLFVVGLFSAIGGPHWRYITASVSQAWPSMTLVDHLSGPHGQRVAASWQNARFSFRMAKLIMPTSTEQSLYQAIWSVLNTTPWSKEVGMIGFITLQQSAPSQMTWVQGLKTLSYTHKYTVTQYLCIHYVVYAVYMGGMIWPYS